MMVESCETKCLLIGMHRHWSFCHLQLGHKVYFTVYKYFCPLSVYTSALRLLGRFATGGPRTTTASRLLCVCHRHCVPIAHAASRRNNTCKLGTSCLVKVNFLQIIIHGAEIIIGFIDCSKPTTATQLLADRTRHYVPRST